MKSYTKTTRKLKWREKAGKQKNFISGLFAGLLILLISMSSSAQDVTPPVLKNPAIGCSSLDQDNADPCLATALLFDGNTLCSAVANLYTDPSLPVTAILLSTTASQDDMSTGNIYCSWKITYEFRIRDNAGNFVTCFVLRKGRDITFPVFTLPNDTILYQGSTCDLDMPLPSVSGNIADVFDNCGVAEITYVDGGIRRVSCTGSKAIERTWRVLDSCGNMTEQMQIIEIMDTTRPVFTVFPENFITARCDNIIYDVQAMDNCTGVADLSYSFSGATTGSGSGSGSGYFFLPGTTTVIVTAYDACGNSTSRSFTLTKTNNDPPVPEFLGDLAQYFMVFTNGSVDANWQGATKGFIGDIAVNGNAASERTSGSVPYAGTLYTNANTLNAWQNIFTANSAQANRYLNETARLTGLESDLENAFMQINGLVVTPGFESRSSTSLNNLNKQNGVMDFVVINVTSGFQVTSKINIYGDSYDIFVLRWDTDADFSNGYNGQVKFQSGGAIVPKGGTTAANFISVAGDINASGGGSNPPAPYPQGPRTNNGTGSLINGGSNFNGGGFFTGYWLTTGAPTIFPSGLQPYGQTASLSNAIFCGAWYTKTSKFSMTSGTSGVYVGSSCADTTISPEIRPCLGDAASFGLLGLDNGNFTINSATNLLANVGYSRGVVSGTNQKIKNFAGTSYVHGQAGNFVYTSSTYNPSGGIIQTNTTANTKLDQANTDALAASANFASLAANISFGSVTTNNVINRVANITVVSMSSMNYNSKTIQFVGIEGGDDAFIINVSGSFDFSQSTVLLTNVRPEKVVWNFPNASNIVINKSSSVFRGTILAPLGSVNYHNPASFEGAIIAKNITVHSDFNLYQKSSEVPCVGLASRNRVSQFLRNSVTNRSGAFSVTAMPNPSVSDFMLHITGNSAEPTRIRLLDISGKEINMFTLNGGISYTRFGANLNAGTYFAEVSKGKNRQVVKLIKMK